jgi:hypothetical protein
MSLLHTKRTTKPGESLIKLIPKEWSWDDVLEYLSTTEGKRKSWNLLMHSLDQKDLPYEVLQTFLRTSFIKTALTTPAHVAILLLRVRYNFDEIYCSVWNIMIKRRYWRSRVQELIDKLLKDIKTHLYMSCSYSNETRYAFLSLRFILRKRDEVDLGNPCDWLFGSRTSSEYYRFGSTGAILDKIGSRPPIHSFIEVFFNTVPAMVTSQDVVKYNLLDSAIHYLHDQAYVKKLIHLYPLALSIKTSLDHSNQAMVLPIQRAYFSYFGVHKRRGLQLSSKEIFKIILHAGIKQKVGGENGFGGLFEDVIVRSEFSAGVDKEGSLFKRIFSNSGGCDGELARVCLEGPNSALLLTKAAYNKGIGWENGPKIPRCLWNVVVEGRLELLDQRDTETGLLPFMLAAVLFDLYSCYELLRHHPSCFHSMPLT